MNVTDTFVAKRLGWRETSRELSVTGWQCPLGRKDLHPPRFSQGNLDFMRALEETLRDDEWFEYEQALIHECKIPFDEKERVRKATIHASKEARRAALIKVLQFPT